MADNPEPGEITVDQAGNVMIGLPTAVSFGEGIVPDGQPEEGDD